MWSLPSIATAIAAPPQLRTSSTLLTIFSNWHLRVTRKTIGVPLLISAIRPCLISAVDMHSAFMELIAFSFSAHSSTTTNWNIHDIEANRRQP